MLKDINLHSHHQTDPKSDMNAVNTFIFRLLGIFVLRWFLLLGKPVDQFCYARRWLRSEQSSSRNCFFLFLYFHLGMFNDFSVKILKNKKWIAIFFSIVCWKLCVTYCSEYLLICYKFGLYVWENARMVWVQFPAGASLFSSPECLDSSCTMGIGASLAESKVTRAWSWLLTLI
jgi:hypothetical protein